MNYRILTLGLLVLFSLDGFSNNLNDTINVTINLQQVDTVGLKINIYPPTVLKGTINYQFPKSIPGIYEFLNNPESIIKLSQNGEYLNCTGNLFSINCDLPSNTLTYTAKSTVSMYKGIVAEDTYYLKDSIYILNWHYLLGFFNAETKHPYKIKIIKDKGLFGSGSLTKNVINDTIDIYVAGNYKELIHSPIMYSVPDTTNFNIGKTNITISCAGENSTLNSKEIKGLLILPLTKILSESHYKPENYSFIYYSEYSLTNPYLTALEHPNSTLICYHSALLDNKILISSSIHEFIHALFAPLEIRSEVIDNFNFTTPKCDELLWFYEGVTEYLTIKTLVNSGFFSPSDFLNELNESDKYHKNINLSKVSGKIYNKKEQKLFDNFYTKGSLFAFQLEIEIIKLSNGKTSLFDVMRNLQKKYNSELPFNSKTFIKEFSLQSGVDIQEYISKNVNNKTESNFPENAVEIGYNQELHDTLMWSYGPKKVFLIMDYKKDRFEYAMFGSTINKEQNCKKITIYEVNETQLTWFNYDIISMPSDGNEIQIKAYNKNENIVFTTKPTLVLQKKGRVNWIKNENLESELAEIFWNK